jgi:hypothetical protein
VSFRHDHSLCGALFYEEGPCEGGLDPASSTLANESPTK